jgi:hypothetical protein
MAVVTTSTQSFRPTMALSRLTTAPMLTTGKWCTSHSFALLLLLPAYTSTSVIGNVSTAWIKDVATNGSRPFFAYIAPKVQPNRSLSRKLAIMADDRLRTFKTVLDGPPPFQPLGTRRRLQT